MDIKKELLDSEKTWNKQGLKSLRMRLGWSRADLARRMDCTGADIESFESGKSQPKLEFIQMLEIIYAQAETCSNELQSIPQCEKHMQKNSTDQVDFEEVQRSLE